MAIPVTVQMAILGTTVSTGNELVGLRRWGKWMAEREKRVTEVLSPGSLPSGWTNSARGAGGGVPAVAPATAMFTKALTPTATRQMGSVTVRWAWPLTFYLFLDIIYHTYPSH